MYLIHCKIRVLWCGSNMSKRAHWYKSTFVQEHNVAEHLNTRALWGEQYDPPPLKVQYGGFSL